MALEQNAIAKSLTGIPTIVVSPKEQKKEQTLMQMQSFPEPVV